MCGTKGRDLYGAAEDPELAVPAEEPAAPPGEGPPNRGGHEPGEQPPDGGEPPDELPGADAPGNDERPGVGLPGNEDGTWHMPPRPPQDSELRKQERVY